jgi:hypothetical protein
MGAFNLLSLLDGLRLLLFLFGGFLRFSCFRFLGASATSHLNEIHDLNFMLASIDNLLDVFSLECSSCSVYHRVESD